MAQTVQNYFQMLVDYKQFTIHFNDYLKERRHRVRYTINNEEVTLETQDIASLQKEVERQLFQLWYEAATEGEIAARGNGSEYMDRLFREYARHFFTKGGVDGGTAVQQ